MLLVVIVRGENYYVSNRGQALNDEQISNMDSYKLLDSNIWKTKNSRHLAASRLKKKNIYSQYTITILSIYVLALSIGPKFGYVANLPADQINFINILLSIAIIAISLLESNNNYQIQAERLYHCANELAQLLIRLNHIKDFSVNPSQDLKQIGDDYDNIIQKYSENHSDWDYKYFLASIDKTGWGKFIFIIIRIKYFIWAYGMYLILIFSPLICFVLIYKNVSGMLTKVGS
jgi:hypothetical protein